VVIDLERIWLKSFFILNFVVGIHDLDDLAVNGMRRCVVFSDVTRYDVIGRNVGLDKNLNNAAFRRITFL
jgi:hypothetical protein